MTQASKLIHIDQLKNKLAHLPNLPDAAEKRNLEAFIVAYTYNTNAIEGSTLSLHETRLALVEGVTIDKKPISDYMDAINHKEALLYMLDMAKPGHVITEQDIKMIHSLVLASDRNIRGVYRNYNVAITGTDYVPTDHLMIQEEMEKLIQQLATVKTHPVVDVAVNHITFEKIHPFGDGNGRTGRLLLNLELIRQGYQPIDIKYQDRDKYIGALLYWDEPRDTAPFVDLIVDYQLAAIQARYDNVKRLG